MNKKFYITTAIPYVNSVPHLGFALEIVQADVIARYYRNLLDKDRVYFLTGTDENALKNVQAAEEEGITPREVVDKYSFRFKALREALNLSFNGFIRTTEKRHILGARKFWQACKKDIYKTPYKGWYCVGCEEFKLKKDLVDGKCPEHSNQDLEFIEEENYFFDLKKYEQQLEKFIKNDKIKINPPQRKHEVLSFIARGLENFSISRSVKRAKSWGIPVPGDPTQIIYVWFDALLNYITGLNYVSNDKLFKKFWLGQETHILHCIGKGITRFHAIYWPAMLMSAGLLPPEGKKSGNVPIPIIEEFVHGYVTVEGRKISKSLGNVIDPFKLVEKYGTDALRYYLLKEISPTKDGDFNIKHFKEIYNADLANGLGNLVQRVAKLAEKVGLGNLKNKKTGPRLDAFLSIPLFEFHKALDLVWQHISTLDKYIDTKRPWEQSGNELRKTLTKIIVPTKGSRSILEIAATLKPFLPETAERIEKIFTASKIKVPKKPLFPRLK